MARLINYRNILLDKDNMMVMLKEKVCGLDLAVLERLCRERAKCLMKEMGVESGIVNASEI